ncbi:hypothetical protein ATANTOWER_015769 [Ataeniobius toweri]|uniref:Uncharacterized protein n=1 Tax=Ataeniobius toweri TaxID=208326 RepID=A0ABU7AFF4_9TELE|nr:hypothetical protein [Ataeniobius toweri]
MRGNKLRTTWRDDLCRLFCLGIPKNLLESVAGQRDVWVSALDLISGPVPHPLLGFPTFHQFHHLLCHQIILHSAPSSYTRILQTSFSTVTRACCGKLLMRSGKYPIWI